MTRVVKICVDVAPGLSRDDGRAAGDVEFAWNLEKSEENSLNGPHFQFKSLQIVKYTNIRPQLVRGPRSAAPLLYFLYIIHFLNIYNATDGPQASGTLPCDRSRPSSACTT